jgi:hypothetical protein
MMLCGTTKQQACHLTPLLSYLDLHMQVPSDKFQGVTAANLVHKSGANVTALVYEDSAYGYGLAFNFIAGFTKGEPTGVGVLGSRRYGKLRVRVWASQKVRQQHTCQ